MNSRSAGYLGAFFNLRFQRRFTRGVAAHLSLTYGKNNEGKEEKRHLTDSRARVGFRFNVCSHVGRSVGEDEGRSHSSHPSGDDEKQPCDRHIYSYC